ENFSFWYSGYPIYYVFIRYIIVAIVLGKRYEDKICLINLLRESISQRRNTQFFFSFFREKYHIKIVQIQYLYNVIRLFVVFANARYQFLINGLGAIACGEC